MNATRFGMLFALALALAVGATAVAKDELIPTRPKTRERQGPENPMRDIADDMGSAARYLGETKTGDLTQQIQKTIVEKLETLIEAARQQQQKQSKGGQGEAKQRQQKQPQPQPADQEKQKQASKPAQAKTQQQGEQPGQGRPGAGEATGPLHTEAEEWGNLPPAIRDQLLQTQGEGFPLKYRELLRRYYRELSKPRD